MQANKYEALGKALVIFNSCQTMDQVKVAERYARQVRTLFVREHTKHARAELSRVIGHLYDWQRAATFRAIKAELAA